MSTPPTTPGRPVPGTPPEGHPGASGGDRAVGGGGTAAAFDPLRLSIFATAQYRTQTNYLRVYLAQLRRRLEPDPANPRYLITTPGQGYTLAAAPIASMPGDDPAREASGRPSPPPGSLPPGQPPPGSL